MAHIEFEDAMNWRTACKATKSAVERFKWSFLAFQQNMPWYTGIEDQQVTRLVSLFPNTVRLDLSHCSQIGEKGFCALAGLTKLQRLELQDGSIGSEPGDSSALASICGNLTGLTRLSLGRTAVKGDVAAIARLTRLAHLDLTECVNLELGHIATLSCLSKLTTLCIGECPLHHADVHFLGELLRLVHLEVSFDEEHFQDRELAVLTKLADLRFLHIRDSESLQQLPVLPELRGLSVKDSAHCARSWSSLQNLCTLDLTGTDIVDSELQMITQLTNLSDLQLNWCDLLTDTGFMALKVCIQLTALSVSNTGCGDRGVQGIVELSRLQRLVLMGCHRVSTSGVALLSTLNALQDLDFSVSASLHDASMAEVGRLTNLKALDVNGSTLLSNMGYHCLGSLLLLTRLDLSDCAAVDDEIILRCIVSMVSLVLLSLDGCTALTRQGLSRLSKLLKLRIISGNTLPGAWPPNLRVMKWFDYMMEHVARVDW